MTISVSIAKHQIEVGEEWAALTAAEDIIQFAGSFGEAAKIASSMPTNKVGKVTIAVDEEDVESVVLANVTAQTAADFWSYSE
jgi:hypothetical protein